MPEVIMGNEIGSWEKTITQEELDGLLVGSPMSDEMRGCDGECESGRRNCGHAEWVQLPDGTTNRQ